MNTNQLSVDMEEVEKTTTDGSDIEMDDAFTNLSSGSVLDPDFDDEDAVRPDTSWDTDFESGNISEDEVLEDQFYQSRAQPVGATTSKTC